MNKTELIERIAASAGLSKADAKNERPAHEGINPATKQKIQIPAKKVAKFKAGAELADAVNK